MAKDPAAADKSEEIEFWFEFGSTYSYLSVMRIEDLAAKHGIRVSWQPFLLGPIFQSFGWNTSPFVLQKEKGEYVHKDMARQCRKYGIPWKMPTQFPRVGVLPLRVMLIGAGEAWASEFAKQVMLLNFYHDREINSPSEIASVLTDLGQPAAEIVAQAQSHPIRIGCGSKPKRRRGSRSSARRHSLCEARCSGETIAWMTLFYLRLDRMFEGGTYAG